MSVNQAGKYTQTVETEGFVPMQGPTRDAQDALQQVQQALEGQVDGDYYGGYIVMQVDWTDVWNCTDVDSQHTKTAVEALHRRWIEVHTDADAEKSLAVCFLN